MTGDRINTHHLRVGFGKHRGELWTRVPSGYLKWLINVGAGDWEIALAELERRGVPIETGIEISGHAVDRASLKLLKLWRQNRNEDEGLHAWLMRGATEARAKGKEIRGRIHYAGIKWVFKDGNLWITLATVMPEKEKENVSD